MPLTNSPEEKEGNLDLPYKKISITRKILKGVLLAVALASASPVFADTKADTQPNLGVIDESNDQEIFKLLQQFPAMSLAHQKSISEVYEKASPDKKALILKVLNEPYSFPKLNHKDYTLVIQQQIINLYEQGELAPKTKSGVILPADRAHSGKDPTNNDDIIADWKPRITIENATEEQVKAWLNAMKDPEQWTKDLQKEEFNERNGRGGQGR